MLLGHNSLCQALVLSQKALMMQAGGSVLPGDGFVGSLQPTGALALTVSESQRMLSAKAATV